MYLWSTENGFEFFVENSLPINENNYEKIKSLLDIYGTDRRSESIISSIEASGDAKQRNRSFIDAIRREGNRLYSESSRANSQEGKENSNRTGNDEYNVANTKSKVELMVNPDTMEIYGFAHEGQIYIDKTKINPNTLIHEYTHLWCKAVQSWNPSTGNANIKYSLVNYLFVIT